MSYPSSTYQPAHARTVSPASSPSSGGTRTTVLQAKIDTSPRQVMQQKRVAILKGAIIQRKGLPAGLKAGIEQLSGMSMDDVRVHYNSAKPAGVGALAYAQGSDIYLAPGQDRHLAHEAWHVVQQRQGRVRPTIDVNGMAVNDNVQLEREADVMGARANGG
ncbi:eCIS core domain-containing protein [Spirosoma rhododendri]|nr:DUF4157 domain-containing protein [Spirosoma rhododendri]